MQQNNSKTTHSWWGYNSISPLQFPYITNYYFHCRTLGLQTHPCIIVCQLHICCIQGQWTWTTKNDIVSCFSLHCDNFHDNQLPYRQICHIQLVMAIHYFIFELDIKLNLLNLFNMLGQFRIKIYIRPVAGGDAPPNLPKGPLLATKWTKKKRCF